MGQTYFPRFRSWGWIRMVNIMLAGLFWAKRGISFHQAPDWLTVDHAVDLKHPPTELGRLAAARLFRWFADREMHQCKW